MVIVECCHYVLIHPNKNILPVYSFRFQHYLILILISIFSSSDYNSYAQENQVMNNDGFFIDISVGIAKFSNQHSAYSSQEFAGSLPFFRSLFEFVDGKNHHLLHIGYAAGKLYTSQAPKASLRETYLHADYFYSRNIGNVNTGKWRNEAGAGVTTFYSTNSYEEFINSTEAMELVTSVSGTFKTTYIISESGGWSISNRITLPIISLASQPGINLIAGQAGLNTNNSVNALRFIFIPDYFRINNQFQAEKRIGNRHMLMLGYTWDVYSIQSVYRKRQAYHLLAFAYKVKI